MDNTIIPQFTNHVGILLDASGSMGHLRRTLITKFYDIVTGIRKSSIEKNQDTRLSVFDFSDPASYRCLVYDMDAMRPISIENLYQASGRSTALLDATSRIMTDMGKISTLYGDHAFLVYVLTDGENNRSVTTSVAELQEQILRLPENWTMAAMVPDGAAAKQAREYGFPVGNILKWTITKEGLEDLSDTIAQATTQYMTNRSAGIRATKTLFVKPDLASVTQKTVTSNLKKLASRDFAVHPVLDKVRIDQWALNTVDNYKVGSIYYELCKTERVQPQKQLLIRNSKSGHVYGGPNIRSFLGLPNAMCSVKPNMNGDWEIYIQSTSVNRVLFGGSRVIQVK